MPYRRPARVLIVLLAALVAVPATHAQEAPAGTAGTAEPTCKVKSVVVVGAGAQTAESAELLRMVTEALGRYPCYKVRDPVESLEAGVGQASAAVEEGKREAETGQAEFLAMRLAAARDHFKAAVEAFGNGFPALPYSGPLFDALMHLGACEAGTGRHERAVDAFRAALRLRPEATLDDYAVVPEAEAAFAAARERSRSAGTGALSVDSDPGAAEVYLDGKFVGVTPWVEAAVPAGPHWVSLRKVGFERRGMAIDVPEGGSTAVPPSRGKLTPARRRPLYENAVVKLGRLGPDGSEAVEAIEDVKALFLSDLAVVVHASEAAGGRSARLSLWDLATMQRVWSGVEPEQGFVAELGRGTAESLVSRALAAYDERAGVKESGAATVKVRGGIHTKWWFWTIIGAAVVGGTTAALVLTRPQSESHGLPHDQTGAVVIRF